MIFSPETRLRLHEIYGYLAERNRRSAVETLRRIKDVTDKIAERPFMGRDYDGVSRVFAVPRTRYRIFYRVREDKGVVEVLTVAHSSQMPPSFKR